MMPSPTSTTRRHLPVSLIFASGSEVGTPGAAPGGHRGLIKNSGGNYFDVSGIPSEITGSLP